MFYSKLKYLDENMQCALYMQIFNNVSFDDITEYSSPRSPSKCQIQL